MGGPGNITTSDVVVLEVLIKVSASLSLVGSLFIIVSYIFFKVSLLRLYSRTLRGGGRPDQKLIRDDDERGDGRGDDGRYGSPPSSARMGGSGASKTSLP